VRLPFGRNGHAPAPSAELREIAQERDRLGGGVALLQERLAELELALESDGWVPWGDRADGSEFGRAALDTLVRRSRMFYLHNPLINRAVEVSALYVWGQDLTVQAGHPDADAVIQSFWDANRRAITGQQASRALEVELKVCGNVFLALFGDPLSGAVKVRPVPVEQIREVITNPDDRMEPWYYRRRWSQTDLEGRATQAEALYPDWRYRPAVQPDAIGTTPIEWGASLCHVKVGGFLHWLFGCPETYAAQDWARAYKESLEDDSTRSRALARFALILSTPGGKRGVAAAKSKLGTTFGTSDLAPDTNPPPLAGSTFIGAEGVDLKAMSVGGAMPPADHSRPLRVMTAAGVGLPDTFFGDADVGNHATASTLDRPTELMANERRNLWRDTYSDLLGFVIDRAATAPLGPLRKWATGVNPDGTVLWRDDPATGEPFDTHVDLDWPDLLEADVTKRVGAIVSAATLDGHPAVGTIPPETLSRLLMGALGVDDLDDELETLFPDAAGDQQTEGLTEALRDFRALIQQQLAT
jgi:hypothetical protein